MKNNIQDLKSIKSIDRINYAVKANPHPQILKSIEAQGLSFDCVSIQEIRLLFEIFPDLDPKRIIFTPNFVERDEYLEALNLGVFVTLDNTYPLEKYPQIFENHENIQRRCYACIKKK